MLRSLTNHFRIESNINVGISVSRNYLNAVALSESRAEVKVIWTKQIAIDSPLFEANHSSNTGVLLQKALKPLATKMGRNSCPVHVALPDITIRSATFELDELPNSKTTLSALAHWKMSKELGKSEGDLECRAMYFGRDSEEKHLLYVQAAERLWIDQCRSAFNACGIIPWTINSSSFFRVNYIFQKNHAIAPAAMMSVDDDCWSLLVWDDKRRIRLSVSRVRNPSDNDEDIGQIINELVMTIRAWQMKKMSSDLNTLYLDGCESSSVAMIKNSICSDLFNEIVSMKDCVNDGDRPSYRESSKKSLAFMAAMTA